MKKDISITNELTQISPLLAGLEPKPTLEVPSGYFTDLPSRLFHKLKTETEAPNYSGLPENNRNENLYSIPATYFEELPYKILRKLNTEKKPYRIVAMPVLKWAVAACIIGLIGFGLYNRYFISGQKMNSNKEWQMSYELSKSILQKNDLEEIFDQLDDNTISGYLKENGHDVNAALLASITETEKINDVNEYFCDEEDLGSIMNDLNIAEKQ